MMTDAEFAIHPVVAPPAASQANGTAPPGPKIPRTELWRELPEPYQEFRLKFWFDHPAGIMANLDGDDAINQAVARVFLEHNGWQDDQGVLPPPSDPEFVNRCPTHLLVTAFGMVRQATTTLPNSMTQTRRR